MNPRFNPLHIEGRPPADGGKSAAPFKPKVIPAADVKQPFQSAASFFAGRKSEATGEGTSNEDEPDRKNELKIKREADRIARLSVHCACGRVHQIDCEYPG